MKPQWNNPKTKIWTKEVYWKNLITQAKYWGNEDQFSCDSKGIVGNWKGDEIPKA
jgi:hypothetical protein